MDNSLLATKLRIPPLPARVLQRRRLVDALERAIPRYKLVRISAPAGYGKTTLLAQWAQVSRFPVAWLSLGEDDNDLDRFLRYLLAAWEQVRPDIRNSPLGLLLDAREPDGDAVLAAFVNVASQTPGHLVFVLDDYHLIEEPSIHRSLAFLLDHLPQTHHFVLAGRVEPPLSLARYRAHAEMLELQVEDMQFSAEEAADFLRSSMDLDLSSDQVAALQAQLEGWAAGLQLAALTLQRRPSRAADTEELSINGRHRFIADYLSEEVLAHLPAVLRGFLLRTSVLERLCGPLCDAVTQREDGQSMLELLERQNLFLAPQDDSRRWYRYHQLFAAFLHEQLLRQHPGEVAELHRSAARWHLEQNLPEQAFRHAVASKDVTLVLAVAERYAVAKLLGGEVTLVKRWIESLPESWYADHPQLALLRATSCLFTGQFDVVARRLDEVERMAQARSEEMRRPLARVTAVRCFVACYNSDLERAEVLALRALRELPEDDYVLRHGIYGALGDTYRRYGRWGEARANYLKGLELSEAHDFRAHAVDVYGALADLDLRQGRLQAAAAYWRQALALIDQPESRGAHPLPLIGWVYIRLGEILYEWNDVAAAWEHLTRGLERVELGGDARGMIAGYLLAGRLMLAQGQTDAAVGYLERTRPLLQNSPLPEWSGGFERLQAGCRLAQGRLRPAFEWAAEIARIGILAGEPENEAALLAAARLLIAKGDPPSLDQASTLLDELLRTAAAEGRTGVQIEALALEALRQWRRGEQAGALTVLERALRLAEPEGYVRLFADLGLPMARLLQEARSRGVMPDTVEKLLAACADGASAGRAGSADPVLPEPLTQREQEILALVAAGLTNREMAERLIISAETVKKHLASIYGKLGAANRTEAAARARELDLLS